MQLLTALTGLLVCLTTVVSGQTTKRSGPFNLVLESSVNKTLNGLRLTACHSGAAIESLCTYPSAANSISDEFYYNYTTSSGSTPPTSGIITWNLPVTEEGNKQVIVSEPMIFSYDPSTNVALPVFFPSTDDQNVQVTFDKNGYMYVLSYLNDTVTPPKYQAQQLSRWQLCTTFYGSYTYTTLAWTLGTGKPENPSCQAVKVKRQAIPK